LIDASGGSAARAPAPPSDSPLLADAPATTAAPAPPPAPSAGVAD
jgi:hypothetical protein